MRIVFSKWGGGRHWEFDARPLGGDEHGHWYAVPSGTSFVRPGKEFVSGYAAVVLVPDRPWVAMFKPVDETEAWSVYVDVTTVPEVRGEQVLAVDLDLDVLRLEDGSTVVDDEDEFDEHRLSLGYPDEVVALATASCAELVELLTTRTPPFDDATPARWLRP